MNPHLLHCRQILYRLSPNWEDYCGVRQKCANHNNVLLLLAFQGKKDPSLWTCPFHPPLQLFFVIRNTGQLRDFGLTKIKVWNYWTADGVSNRLRFLTEHLTDGST